MAVSLNATTLVALGIGAAIVVFFMMLLSCWRKVGPNEALIISGPSWFRRRGFRIVQGGGTMVIPIFEQVQSLSLELMPLEIQEDNIYTLQGVPVSVDAIAQVKVRGDETAIATAAEQFLSKTPEEIRQIAQNSLQGHLRAIVATLTVEDLYRNQDAFAQRVAEVAEKDLANMGLTIVSFTIRAIRDKQGYLDALGRPRIAQVKRDARIAEAEAERDATIQAAKAQQEAKAAEFAAQTKIAESQRDFEMRQAEFQAQVNQKKAEADIAYDLRKYQLEQELKREQVRVQLVEREALIEVQEKEIVRKEKELDATVRKPAQAEADRIRMIADAERYRTVAQAEAEAEAKRKTGEAEAQVVQVRGLAEAEVIKAKGLAEAEAEKAQGLAEAEVVRAKGLAEAEAMMRKAEAWRHFNQAAISQMFIERLPEITRALAEPLSKVDRIVVISNAGNGVGASRITQDVVNMVAQIPPVLESLTGINVRDLVTRLPGIQQSDAGQQSGDAGSGASEKSTD
ncbi:MAG: SPFH domain-containing protein [Armatimonadota bacterium]|nr:SPFH domain-containing protein [Armatimonadota bacterium]